jgi:hypothetical protein
MRKGLMVTAAALGTLAAAQPAAAERAVFNNWHVHSGFPGAKAAAFFPALLGVSLAEYQANPSLWAYCPDATDKLFLPSGAPGSKIAAGVCMNERTVIHLMTVQPDQSAPEGWARVPGTSTAYYKLTPHG